MTDLGPVLKVATRLRTLGITRRQSRERVRRLLAEADRVRDRRDWPEAVRLYREVLELDPLRRGVRVQLGHAYKEIGDLANAGLCYHDALQAAPLDDDIHLQIGHLEKLKGSRQEAAAAYRKSAELNPLNSDAVREYAALAASLGLPALHLAGGGNGASRSDNAAGGEAELAPQQLRARGDSARDARRWDEAAEAYRAYLARVPEDAAIWVQLGHALKEGGHFIDSEAAYRTALGLAAEDADIHLQLGHLLKLRGRREEAAAAYRRSFRLRPLYGTWSELRTLGLADDELAVRPETAATRPPQILLDVSDLLVHLAKENGVSGIQRVQLALLAFVEANPLDAEVRFCIWRDKALWLLPDHILAFLVPGAGTTAANKEGMAELIAAIEAEAILYVPVAGDTLVATGVLYLQPDLLAQREQLKRAGVRLGACFHDFIPLTHPEYCAEILVGDFCNAAAEALLQLDFVLTVSEHVAAEARRLLRQAGYPALPVRTVPNAHLYWGGQDAAANGADHWTPAIAGLRGRDFVLCVGTLSLHKNQGFLVQVWQLLEQEGFDPPLLVLAGSRNLGADEILQRLASGRNVDGRVRVIDSPTDSELGTLYRNCLFTMFPSLVEGWGLPIGESLSWGKVCIASRLAAMPEVGGDHALYVDPYNVRACADLVRELCSDRGLLAAREARVRDEFKPRRWDEHARDFFAAVRESAAAGGKAARLPLGVAAPGTIIRPLSSRHGWPFGKSLPAHDAFADSARGRAVLLRGWRQPEYWGAWMAGRSARIAFGTTATPGSQVTVLLQCRVAPWSRNNVLRITSGCGAIALMPVPESGTTETRWRGQRYKEMVAGIDCTVAADGSVDLSLEVIGALRRGWWGETRNLCIGLMRLVHVPADAAAPRQPPYTRFRPAALTGPAGEPAYPVGLRSMLAVLHANRMLAAGWELPEGDTAWMSGARARLILPTDTVPHEIVRVALQLRSSSSPADAAIALSAADGGSRLWQLPGGGAAEWVWLDCRSGADGFVRLDIADQADAGPVPGRRLGLVSLAYGSCEAPEGRLALTEAMLQPMPAGSQPVQAALRDDLRFTIVGHLRGSYSLAAINRSLALGLEEAYPGTVRVEQIETDPVRDLSGAPAAERQILSRLAERAADPAGADVAIVQHWPVLPPPQHFDLPLALFVWEESLVPPAIVEHLNREYRGIIVQTRAVQKVLLDSGIALPVHRVGCAIDLAPFAAVAERRAAAGPRPPIDAVHPLVFLHVSSCFPRKGVDVLLAAFAAAFRAGDPVKLVIKTFPNPHNDAAQQIDDLREADPEAPAIELIDQDLDAADFLRLYEAADAMVLPTRGEGFNMPAAEAMAAGLPLIVTGHGGHMDFVDATVARLLDYRFLPSQSHVRGPASVWAEPDREDLVAALRQMFDTARAGEAAFAARITRGRAAVAPLGDRAAWGRRVADAACRLITADPARYVRLGWVSTWKVRCGIAEYSRHLLGDFEAAVRDVTVFCDERTDRDQLAARDGPAAEIAWRISDEASMDDLAAAIDSAGVDAVVVQQHVGYLPGPALIRLLSASRLASRPVLVFLHNVRHFLREEAEERADIIAALRRAARVLVHSTADLDLLKSCGLLDNVVLFPHGAERTGLAPRPVHSFAAGGAPLLGAYGYFLPPKRFDRLIRALPALRARWRGLRLRFVTAEYPVPESAAALAQCRELARSLGVADAIEWVTDYLPNSRSLELLNECDLVVLPYADTTESASGAVRVAIGSRAPVVVTPIRIFEDLGDAVGRLAAGEIEDIVVGVTSLLNSEAERREIIDQADRWLDNHDWRLMAARLHGMVAGLLATGRTGGA